MPQSFMLHDDLAHVLEYTRDIWQAFRRSRLFITGGTGFVGKWLLQTFLYVNEKLSLGAEAVVLSRHPQYFATIEPRLAANGALHLWPGDVRDFEYPPGSYTHVIHGATDVAASASPLDTFDVNVQGTRRVLDFCRSRGVRDLLLISSGAVYGQQPSELSRIDEGYSGAPMTTALKSAYGEGKRASEWLATAYGTGGTPAVRIARCFALVGPYLPLDGQFAVGNFIADYVAGRDIEVRGDGTAVRSYLYAADLAIWLWVILARGIPGEAYNVGGTEPISIAELAERIACANGRRLRVCVRCAPVPGAAPERYVPAIGKAREALGLQPVVSLDAALSRTIAWATRTAVSAAA